MTLRRKGATAGRAPLLSVFGGKITTDRKLAEHALDKLAPFLSEIRAPWTAGVPLPCGDMPDADFGGWLARSSALLTTIDHMLKDGTAYHGPGHDHFDRRAKAPRRRRLVARLQHLGYAVEIKPLAA